MDYNLQIKIQFVMFIDKHYDDHYYNIHGPKMYLVKIIS